MSTTAVVCAPVAEVPAAYAGSSFQFDGCPVGEVAFLQPVGDAFATFDPLIAAGFFSFGFGLPLFFYTLGLVGHSIIRHFWR